VWVAVGVTRLIAYISMTSHAVHARPAQPREEAEPERPSTPLSGQPPPQHSPPAVSPPASVASGRLLTPSDILKQVQSSAASSSAPPLAPAMLPIPAPDFLEAAPAAVSVAEAAAAAEAQRERAAAAASAGPSAATEPGKAESRPRQVKVLQRNARAPEAVAPSMQVRHLAPGHCLEQLLCLLSFCFLYYDSWRSRLVLGD
jgi:hypothetical protein